MNKISFELSLLYDEFSDFIQQHGTQDKEMEEMLRIITYDVVERSSKKSQSQSDMSDLIGMGGISVAMGIKKIKAANK